MGNSNTLYKRNALAKVIGAGRTKRSFKRRLAKQLAGRMDKLPLYLRLKLVRPNVYHKPAKMVTK